MKVIGRRVAHVCSVYGHPEATMLQVRVLQGISSKQQGPHQTRFPFYRRELAGLLEPVARAYPDTRIYSYLVALELMEGGSRNNAKRYTLDALQRPTRPRDYELALINAGKLVPDDGEALNALQLAYQLMAHPILLPGQTDRFPFATKRRLIYRYHNLERVASVLFDRAKAIFHSDDSNQILRLRSDVLSCRRSLKPHLLAAGVKEGDPEMTSYPRSLTLDDMMFELVDPEVVLEEEKMTKICGPFRTLLHQGGYRSRLRPLLDAVDFMEDMESAVRPVYVYSIEETDDTDNTDDTDKVDMAKISREYLQDVVNQRRDPNRRMLSRFKPFLRKSP
jgi:hypothetical protein